jgi:hypothetical protein
VRSELHGASFAVDVLTVNVLDPDLGPVDYLDSERLGSPDGRKTTNRATLCATTLSASHELASHQSRKIAQVVAKRGCRMKGSLPEFDKTEHFFS